MNYHTLIGDVRGNLYFTRYITAKEEVKDARLSGILGLTMGPTQAMGIKSHTKHNLRGGFMFTNKFSPVTETEQAPIERAPLRRRLLLISPLLLLVIAASVSQGITPAFAQQLEDIYTVNCSYAQKVYALITSGSGPLSAFAVGVNDANGRLAYSHTAVADCTESTCYWTHISDYPDNAEFNGGPLARWTQDRAYANIFIDITTAWCSYNTPPHDVLEQIKDENEDGSISDDLEKHLKKRGSDPIPERNKEELKKKGK
jgi:hypothetical protein